MTVMNFKISFKTWLKVARLEIEGKTADVDKDAQRTCKVDIEVEEFEEYSSEEEEEDNKTGSEGDGSHRASRLGVGSKNSKKKDKHAAFERRMSQKLKANLELRQSGRHMLSAPYKTAKVGNKSKGSSAKSSGLKLNE